MTDEQLRDELCDRLFQDLDMEPPFRKLIASGRECIDQIDIVGTDLNSIAKAKDFAITGARALIALAIKLTIVENELYKL
jgi:hypothetical protein